MILSDRTIREQLASGWVVIDPLGDNAIHKGAELIVAVGTHATLVEFLDKGRSGMASTFLTRLRVGGKLIDAKGVSRLYRQRISNWQLTWLVLAGLLALVVALESTAAGQTLFGLAGAGLDDLWSAVRSLVGGGSGVGGGAGPVAVPERAPRPAVRTQRESSAGDAVDGVPGRQAPALRGRIRVLGRPVTVWILTHCNIDATS